MVDEEFYLSFVWLLLQQPPDGERAKRAIAARRAGADFVRNQEAGGHTNNGSTVRSTPPEIPLGKPRAFGQARKFDYAQDDTGGGAQNFHPTAQKKEALCLCFLMRVNINHAVKVLKGV